MAGSGPRSGGGFFMTMSMSRPRRSLVGAVSASPERQLRAQRRYLAVVTLGLVIMAGLFLAGCDDQPNHSFEKAKRSTNIEDVRDTRLFGDEVFVLARRGWGGKLTDHATANFAADASKLCGIRFEVASGQAWSEWLFKPTHRAMKARKIVLVGTSLGGFVAREHAQRWSYDGNGAPVRLLLVDPVPWTNPIPKNVGADHVVWRNTAPFQLGGGRPEGTIQDAQHDRPAFQSHGYRIHNAQTRKEVAEEICRGITHPRERKK
jgi:hypothetical protein